LSLYSMGAFDWLNFTFMGWLYHRRDNNRLEILSIYSSIS
jgi:hypothetical protein